MASGSAVQVEILASFGQYQTGLAQASQAMAAMVRDMKSSMGEIPSATRPANEAMGGLLGTLKNFKSEQVSQGRTARFFASEISSILPASEGAKSGLQGVISAALELAGGFSGVALGMAAFELGKVVIDALRASSLEAAKAAEAFTKELGKMHDEAAKTGDEVVKLRLEAEGFTPAMIQGAQAVVPAEMALRDLKDAADDVRAAIARLREEELAALVSTGVDASTGDVERAEAQLRALEQKITAQEQLLAARRDKFGAMVGGEEKTGRDESAKTAKKRADEINAILLKSDAERRGATEAADNEAEKFDRERQAEKLKTEKELMEALWKVEEERAAREFKLELEMEKVRKATAQQWMQVGNQIGTALGQAFASVIQGTKSVGEAMKAMAKTVLSTIIAVMKKQIEAYILGAEAAAAFSQAGIPIIGPLLAVAAVASIAALLGGLLGDMPSAATGWDRVPYDMPVMVHKGERIVPKYDTERLDRIEAGGNATTHVSLTINATDAKSVRRLFLENDDALAEAIRQAAKKGRLS